MFLIPSQISALKERQLYVGTARLHDCSRSFFKNDNCLSIGLMLLFAASVIRLYEPLDFFSISSIFAGKFSLLGIEDDAIMSNVEGTVTEYLELKS
jgi:hypothetical protein